MIAYQASSFFLLISPANSSDRERDIIEDDDPVPSIRNQLQKLDLDSNGNNALFIGRTEKEGVDIHNTGSLGPKNLVNRKTKWVFIDSQPRDQQSNNDLVLTIQDLIDFLKKSGAATEEQFREKFKLIVVDSGAAYYILTDAILHKFIDWVRPSDGSTLIFEHIPARVYATCLPPFSPFFNDPWQRQQKWEKGEPISYRELKSGSLRAFPNFCNLFCEIYFNTMYEDKESFHKEELARPKKDSDILCKADPELLAMFKDLSPEFKEHFNKLQQQKIQKELTLYFDTVILKKNDHGHNDAPFVRDRTYNPAHNLFWWVASGKKSKPAMTSTIKNFFPAP
jgi:hypothetical protein